MEHNRKLGRVGKIDASAHPFPHEFYGKEVQQHYILDCQRPSISRNKGRIKSVFQSATEKYSPERNKKNVFNRGETTINYKSPPSLTQMGKNRFKKFMAENSSRRYSIHNKLDVSDIPGAQVAFI